MYPPPKNGSLTCNQGLGLLMCSVECKEGFVFEFRPPEIYYCQGGEWRFWSIVIGFKGKLPWPDCKVSAINFMQSWRISNFNTTKIFIYSSKKNGIPA